MKKRLFSFLMSGCMLFSFMPAASAMAVSNDKVENISTPEKMAQIINRDVHQSGNNLGRGEKKSQLESIVIAKTQVAPENTYGAVDVFYYEYGGYYVLKYEDSQQAKEAASSLKKDFPQSVIFQDKVVHQNTTDNFLGDIRGNILQKSKTEKEEKDTKAEPSAKQEGTSSEEETEKAATDTDDQAAPDENSSEDAQDSAESSDENQQGTEASGEEEEVLPEWLQELANLLKPTKGDAVMGLDVLKDAAEKNPEKWAWAGDDQLQVAVIDSGINYTHKWFNDPETKINRLDTANCVNFASDSASDVEEGAEPYKDTKYQGHGSHVAGIVAHSTPSNVKIMAIRVFDIQNDSTLERISLGLDHARENHAEVVNMSLGQGFASATDERIMGGPLPWFPSPMAQRHRKNQNQSRK